MVPILYTTSTAILACAGMTDEDVSDAFITARDLPRILSVDLFSWLPTHADVYVLDTDTVTPQLRNNSDCLILWCNYFAAARLLDAALTIKQRETDGQSEFERFTNPELTQLAEAARNQAGVYRQTLITALNSTDAITPMAVLSVVAPSYDPVTG